MPNFSAMNRAILNYINSKLPKDKNNALIGTVFSGRVMLGNKSYPYTPAVDMFFGDGDRVACILPDGSNRAFVVGVP